MSCDNESIIAYVYDDLSADERRSFDAHLSVCDACRAEIDGLRATRQHLSLWAPPEPQFAFRIIREAAPAKVLPMRSRWKPALGFAAAAVIVLAVASAIANLEVRYDANGLVARTGWARGDAQSAQTNGPVSDGAVAHVVSNSAEFQALQRRLSELESAVLSRAASPDMQTASARMSDAEILRRVREIVGEAESRQQTALAKRLLQVVGDFDRQRQADLAAIQRGLGTYQGVTNAELAQQRDVINHLYRVAVRQEK